ncbi:MAG: methyltransferase domain-containing protein [Bacteroidetes bacterium]|nr:methyltransferase domain-containing protein [Fibrella sp.]
MNWNAELYTKKHAFVFRYGTDLIDLLDPRTGELILDLGCGSGELTQQIADRGATVIGLDASASMLEKARQQFPALDLRPGDATTFALPERVDAIFSNAVLHWVPDYERAVERMRAHLKPGGRLVTEFGGKDNIGQISRALTQQLQTRGYERQPSWWYFPSVGDYASVLEKHGFRVRLAWHYDRDTRLDDPKTGLTDWIEQFGSNFFVGVSDADKAAVLAAVDAQLRPMLFRNGSWFADYKRLRVVAEKG